MVRIVTFFSITTLIGVTVLVGPRLAELMAQDQGPGDVPPFTQHADEAPFGIVGHPGVDPPGDNLFVDANPFLGIPGQNIYYQDQDRFNPGTPNAPAVRSRNVFTHRYRAGNKKTQEAFEKLANADDDEKRAAERELRRALEVEYDQSLEGYEKNLQRLRDRLEKLEEELHRRQEAKDEIVDLRLRTLVNLTKGLGWPGQDMPSGFAPVPSLMPTQPSRELLYEPARVLPPDNSAVPRPSRLTPNSRDPREDRSDNRFYNRSSPPSINYNRLNRSDFNDRRENRFEEPEADEADFRDPETGADEPNDGESVNDVREEQPDNVEAADESTDAIR